MDVPGVECGGNDPGGMFYIAPRDIYPQVVKVGIVQLQICRVQTGKIGVVRVVVEQSREVIPVGLEEARPGGRIFLKPERERS